MNYFKFIVVVVLLTSLISPMSSTTLRPAHKKAMLTPYIKEFDCENMTLAIGIIQTGVLNRINGDCHFHDHAPLLTVNLILERRAIRVMITGNVKIHEHHHDGTTFENTIEKTILDLKEYQNCEYGGVDEYEGQIRSESRVPSGRIERYQGSGFIEWIDCVSHVKGDNCGKLQCDIRIKPITVKLRSKY
jgi:hypothetical protein